MFVWIVRTVTNTKFVEGCNLFRTCLNAILRCSGRELEPPSALSLFSLPATTTTIHSVVRAFRLVVCKQTFRIVAVLLYGGASGVTTTSVTMWGRRSVRWGRSTASSDFGITRGEDRLGLPRHHRLRAAGMLCLGSPHHRHLDRQEGHISITSDPSSSMARWFWSQCHTSSLCGVDRNVVAFWYFYFFVNLLIIEVLV